ncbi:MAG: twin-arginine translocase TatA/TatE family subunit [candidate division WOR-3 bacterium]
MNLGFQEILVITLVFIILFGPDKIPQVVKAFKRAYTEFTRTLEETKREIREVLDDERNSSNGDKRS